MERPSEAGVGSIRPERNDGVEMNPMLGMPSEMPSSVTPLIL
jgi:hypothetical protein